MGVPSFYRWLANKYPSVVVNAVEDEHCLDTSSPNPNRLKFDNLYLDMNGIIHPCFHPDESPAPPTSFEEVFENIFEYIDRLFNIVRPQKLLFMAIDGVAPRAKMNQQRGRRFRTAKDNEIAEQEEERLRRKFEMEGKTVLPRQESEVSDSNVITPGTEFMHILSNKLKGYICQRIEKDCGWKAIKVILSDSNVPGEGEHKIMSFIRLQRTFPDYNPNTRHCLYGLDADLIMLALATHEVHFSILREDVRDTKAICESGLEFSLLKVEPESDGSEPPGFKAPSVSKPVCIIKKPYQFLHIWILREYMELDMQIAEPPENFRFELERMVDDFVLLCFFAGNDFLPHMPTLEIHEGAIDLLLHVYKSEFKKIGGYIVDMAKVDGKTESYVNLKRVEKFILSVGAYEEKIFKKRSELRERKLRRILLQQQDGEETLIDQLEISSGNVHGTCPNMDDQGIVDSPNASTGRNISSCGMDEIVRNTKELKEKLKEHLRNSSDLFKNGGLGTDKVKLGTVGWKERYYKEKFSAGTRHEIESTRKALVETYTEGLCWVLLYYYSGVPSWTWYYPYHYGPFASDLKGISRVKVKFQKGSPFKPFDQLMGVLPPRSAHALPTIYGSLMTDENSAIIDFYPTDFEVDMDGKRFSWQGICKLPFIDEGRLLNETRKMEKELKKDEELRNGENLDMLFVGNASSLASQVLLHYNKELPVNTNDAVEIDTSLSGEIKGYMRFKSKESNALYVGDDDIPKSNVSCVFYQPLPYRVHIPCLLEAVQIPERTITLADIVENELWHESYGSGSVSRYRKVEHSSFKAAGSGWATGRGRGKEIFAGPPDPFTSNFVNACEPYPASRPHSQCNRRSLMAPNFDNSINSATHRPVHIGIKNLKISNSGFNSDGRAQPLNNNFGRSPNQWMGNVQYGRQNFNVGQAWCHNPRFADPTSLQARGSGGHFVPRAPATNYNVANTNLNARGYASRGRGPECYRPISVAPPASVQAHGRAHYRPVRPAAMRNQNDSFRAPQPEMYINTLVPSPASAQAHGRAHHGPVRSAAMRNQNNSFRAPQPEMYTNPPSASVQARGRGHFGPQAQYAVSNYNLPNEKWNSNDSSRAPNSERYNLR